ncbi:MAG: ATP-binding protein, partial [Povalibacter sp.]
VLHLLLEVEESEAHLHVRDPGIGMDPASLPRIFDLFMQADQSLDRSQSGLGIGLTIAKRLVELHGGRIEARSEGVGQGSEFIVTLPLIRAKD